MLLYISSAMLGLVAVCIVFLMVFPIRLTKKQLGILWMIYIVSLATMAFFIELPQGIDLYRMYKKVDAFRSSGESVVFSAEVLVDIMYWLTAKTNENGWLVFFIIIAFGICVKHIIYTYLDENSYTTKAVVLYFLAVNAGVFVVYLLTGVRSTLVAALWCYAYFKWYNKKKSVYYIIVGCSMFLHLLGLILLVLTWVYEILQKRKNMFSYIVTFGVILIIGYVLNSNIGIDFLASFSSDFTQFVGQKWQAYSNRGHEFQQGWELRFRIINSLYLLACLVFLHLKGNKKNQIFGFFILVMYAGFNMSILFERMPYVLGIASLPIINESINEAKKIGRILIGGMGIMIIGLQVCWGIYESYLWLDFGI